MVLCCKHSSGDLKKLKVNKFEDIKPLIKTENIYFTCMEDDLMFCSPVGNQVKFIEFKADLVLSGYCTAADAAKKYIKDKKKMSSENADIHLIHQI